MIIGMIINNSTYIIRVLKIGMVTIIKTISRYDISRLEVWEKLSRQFHIPKSYKHMP
jgi:hypothetical protein